MAFKYLLCFLLLLNHDLLNCASAAVHGHSIDTHKIDTIERESDGSFRAKDADHYNDAGHNVEFDHEAIIGSVKEAEEYDKLSPEEAKQRLGQLLPKMDLNGDHQINRAELKAWILKSFGKLSKEEADERMSDTDTDKDGLITFSEYLLDAFGLDNEMEIDDDGGSNGEDGDDLPTDLKFTNNLMVNMVREEKLMWEAADANGDGVLDAQEFAVFTNPEEHEVMHGYLVNQTFRERDNNKDGHIDFQEYLGDRGIQQDKEWVLAEKQKFDEELDENHDGILNYEEVHTWVIPNNDEIATDEVDHLFAASDDNHDDILSFDEIVEHHDIFVGSEATDYGTDLQGHFDDEL